MFFFLGENCDIKLKILNKLAHLNQSEIQITVMLDLFFCEGFSLVHVIITTIIIWYAPSGLHGCKISYKFNRTKSAITNSPTLLI